MVVPTQEGVQLEISEDASPIAWGLPWRGLQGIALPGISGRRVVVRARLDASGAAPSGARRWLCSQQQLLLERIWRLRHSVNSGASRAAGAATSAAQLAAATFHSKSSCPQWLGSGERAVRGFSWQLLEFRERSLQGYLEQEEKQEQKEQEQEEQEQEEQEQEEQ
ncbi:PREDICTED: histone acetyltransferase KAT6B-like, partial [Buceros rhinoceros silvestris]|uniref:histone acetyltransferase KAT6B-like n=1 Tax=Buceros rhinoceros silvestris TaxID=175836 RepID=UPI0005291763